MKPQDPVNSQIQTRQQKLQQQTNIAVASSPDIQQKTIMAAPTLKCFSGEEDPYMWLLKFEATCKTAG